MRDKLMESTFKYFIDQIPSEIYTKTETLRTGNIVVFRPTTYIRDVNLHLIDYHFVLPASDPPPMMVEQRENQFKRGRLIAFAPETRVRCTRDVPTRQFIAMVIKKDFFQDIFREVVGKAEILFSRMNNPFSSKLINLINSFEEEIARFKESCPLMMQSISTQIVIQMLRETGNYKEIDGAELRANRNYVNRAIEYMLAYYNANLKMEDICKQIHLSPYYFARMFKDKTGQSPHEFLLSVRIDKAEQMLKSGGYSIEEVARLSGFINAAHFSNYFKRVKGMPPSVYKRKYVIVEK